MLKMLLTMSFISAVTIIFLTHPLSLGLMLLIQTMCISLIMGFFNINFWYSYILFLVMIGGMLVLFLYMTSVASNEKFSFSVKITAMVLVLSLAFFLTFSMMDPYYSNINNFNPEFMHNETTYNLSLTKFLNFPSNTVLYIIILYLLLTLVAVVKIVNIKKGPLRQAN